MSKIPALNLAIIESDFAQLERIGVRYGYGAKAAASAPIGSFNEIDCSGYFYWAIARGSGGKVRPPHGSQNQLSWLEENAREVDYRLAAMHMTASRLFAAVIKPHTNGCGKVGHIWLLSAFDDGNNKTFAGTLESHGGAGINSRPWNYPTLLREVYKCFELPTG